MMKSWSINYHILLIQTNRRKARKWLYNLIFFPNYYSVDWFISKFKVWCVGPNYKQILIKFTLFNDIISKIYFIFNFFVKLTTQLSKERERVSHKFS